MDKDVLPVLAWQVQLTTKAIELETSSYRFIKTSYQNLRHLFDPLMAISMIRCKERHCHRNLFQPTTNPFPVIQTQKVAAMGATSTQTVYTPDAVIDLVAESLKPALPPTLFLIKGLYRQTSTTLFGGYYYGRLHSTTGGYELTVRVPEKIKPAPANGQHYVFSGYLTKRPKKKGHVDLVFSVTAVEGREPQEFSRIISTYQQKARLGYRDVVGMISQKIISGERVKIARLYGHNGIVDKDVEAALNVMDGDSEIVEKCYEFTDHRVSMGSPSDIEAELKKLDQEGYNLIAILRGGGSNLSVFDDLGLASTAATLNTPLITGIGHEVDKPFVQDVVDKSCVTPSAFGYFLRDKAVAALTERTQIEKEKEQQAQHLEALIKEREQVQQQLLTLGQAKHALEERVAQGQVQASQNQQKLAGLVDELARSNQQLQAKLNAEQEQLEQTRSQLADHVAKLNELNSATESKSTEIMRLTERIGWLDREKRELASALTAKETEVKHQAMHISELEQENRQLRVSADNNHAQALRVQCGLSEENAMLQQTIHRLNDQVTTLQATIRGLHEQAEREMAKRARFNRLALAGATLLIVIAVLYLVQQSPVDFVLRSLSTINLGG